MARPSPTIIDILIQEMRGFLESEENLHVLNVQANDFSRMEDILGHIRKKFQDQQNKLPELIERCLETLKDNLEEAKYLINPAKRPQRGFFSCCFDCNRNDKLSRQNKEWKRGFEDLYQQLQSLSVAAKTQTEDSARPPRPPELKSGHNDQQIAESARPTELQKDASADNKQIVESMDYSQDQHRF